MKSIKEIRKIVKFCKQSGIFHYKDEGFEFQLSRAALIQPKEELISVPIAGLPDTPQMDPMDLLLWSSTPAQFEEPNA